MIGFTGALAALATRLVPERVAPQRPAAAPRWLDDALLDVPAVALDAARRELGEIAARLRATGARIMQAGRLGDAAGLAAARADDDVIDALHAAKTIYLSSLRRRALTGADAATLRAIHVAANDLEAIGDLLDERATLVIERWIADGRPPTPAARIILDQLFATALRAVEMAARAAAENDRIAAQEAESLGVAARRLADRVVATQAEHLGETGPERLAALRFEIDLVTLLRQIADHAVRCAATVARMADET